MNSEGHHYDIEVQRQDRGAGERRARFNSSLLDAKLLRTGQNPDEIPDFYVIFITENDRIGQLMNDFRVVSADQTERVRYFKEDAEGVKTMCKAMEDMRNEAVYDERVYNKEVEKSEHFIVRLGVWQRGTKILMADGSERPVEDMKIGERKFGF